MFERRPAANRNPKYVPPVDADGNYTADAIFANLSCEQTPQDLSPELSAMLTVCCQIRRPKKSDPYDDTDPLAENHPPQTGHPNPRLSPRDASS